MFFLLNFMTTFHMLQKQREISSVLGQTRPCLVLGTVSSRHFAKVDPRGEVTNLPVAFLSKSAHQNLIDRSAKLRSMSPSTPFIPEDFVLALYSQCMHFNDFLDLSVSSWGFPAPGRERTAEHSSKMIRENRARRMNKRADNIHLLARKKR
jgi:hypothetical protein